MAICNRAPPQGLWLVKLTDCVIITRCLVGTLKKFTAQASFSVSTSSSFFVSLDATARIKMVIKNILIVMALLIWFSEGKSLRGCKKAYEVAVKQHFSRSKLTHNFIKLYWISGWGMFNFMLLCKDWKRRNISISAPPIRPWNNPISFIVKFHFSARECLYGAVEQDEQVELSTVISQVTAWYDRSPVFSNNIWQDPGIRMSDSGPPPTRELSMTTGK